MQRIGFLDNTIHHILKSFDAIREIYPASQLFSHEAEMYEYLEKEGLDVVLMNLDLSPNDAIHIVQEIRSMKLQHKQPLLVVYSLKQDDFVQEVVLEKGADAFVGFHRKPAVLRPFLKNLLARRQRKERSRFDASHGRSMAPSHSAGIRYIAASKNEPMTSLAQCAPT